MASKVTILLGAGASANTLPLVKDIPTRLIPFRRFIHDHRSGGGVQLAGGLTQREVEDEFLRDCDEIIQLLTTRQHASIDTYAKRLRLNIPHTEAAKMKYDGLKAILSAYFISEQLKNPTDYRYDSFLASILGDSHTDFPEHLRILTWNYDFQFEKAYSIYSGQNTLSANQSQLRVVEAGRNWVDTNIFAIYKLNGTTNFLRKRGGRSALEYVYDNLILPTDKELVEKFMMLYNNVIYDYDVHSSLTFAWEENWEEETRSFLEKTAAALAGTETLVVIGYSFPFFNRTVDRRMIKALGPYLSKVYIQDLDADNVANNFKSVLPDIFSDGSLPEPQIIKMQSVDQFFLPPEL